MTHIDLLDLHVGLKCFGNRSYLLICKHVLKEIQVSERQEIEQVRQYLSTDLIIVNIDVTEITSILQYFN